MARLVDITLQSLRGSDFQRIDDALLVALSFCEKSRGWVDALPCQEVLGEEVTDDDLLHLRDAMIHLVRAHPLEDIASTAVFVLGKWEDPTLKTLFIEFMKATCEGDKLHPMFNAMIALDRLGEAIFPRENGWMSAASNQYERNRNLAQSYLKKENQCQ